MSGEAKFVISYNFTTVRGDTYEEFVHNCQQAFGAELGQTVAVRAMGELASHFAGDAVAAQSVPAVVNTLGAQQLPTENVNVAVAVPTQPGAYQSPYQAAPQQPLQQPGFQQPAVGTPYPGDCAHGPKKFVAAGVSRQSGKPYPAFWACQAPQGQQKCRG